MKNAVVDISDAVVSINETLNTNGSHPINAPTGKLLSGVSVTVDVPDPELLANQTIETDGTKYLRKNVSGGIEIVGTVPDVSLGSFNVAAIKNDDSYDTEQKAYELKSTSTVEVPLTQGKTGFSNVWVKPKLETKNIIMDDNTDENGNNYSVSDGYAGIGTVNVKVNVPDAVMAENESVEEDGTYYLVKNEITKELEISGIDEEGNLGSFVVEAVHNDDSYDTLGTAFEVTHPEGEAVPMTEGKTGLGTTYVKPVLAVDNGSDSYVIDSNGIKNIPNGKCGFGKLDVDVPSANLKSNQIANKDGKWYLKEDDQGLFITENGTGDNHGSFNVSAVNNDNRYSTTVYGVKTGDMETIDYGSGYTGLGRVKLQARLQRKTETVQANTGNEPIVVSADSGYAGLRSVSINVNVPDPEIPTKYNYVGYEVDDRLRGNGDVNIVSLGVNRNDGIFEEKYQGPYKLVKINEGDDPDIFNYCIKNVSIDNGIVDGMVYANNENTEMEWEVGDYYFEGIRVLNSGLGGSLKNFAMIWFEFIERYKSKDSMNEEYEQGFICNQYLFDNGMVSTKAEDMVFDEDEYVVDKWKVAINDMIEHPLAELNAENITEQGIINAVKVHDESFGDMDNVICLSKKSGVIKCGNPYDIADWCDINDDSGLVLLCAIKTGSKTTKLLEDFTISTGNYEWKNTNRVLFNQENDYYLIRCEDLVSGYYANVVEKNKSVMITENGNQVISASTGYDTMKEVSVNVQVYNDNKNKKYIYTGYNVNHSIFNEQTDELVNLGVNWNDDMMSNVMSYREGGYVIVENKDGEVCNYYVDMENGEIVFYETEGVSKYIFNGIVDLPVELFDDVPELDMFSWIWIRFNNTVGNDDVKYYKVNESLLMDIRDGSVYVDIVELLSKPLYEYNSNEEFRSIMSSVNNAAPFINVMVLIWEEEQDNKFGVFLSIRSPLNSVIPDKGKILVLGPGGDYYFVTGQNEVKIEHSMNNSSGSSVTRKDYRVIWEEGLVCGEYVNKVELLKIQNTNNVSGNVNVTPSAGYNSMKEVKVNLNAEVENEKVINDNGSYGVDYGGKYMKNVMVEVEPNLEEKYIYENGEYDAEDDNVDGYSRVIVEVPESDLTVGQITDYPITSNGNQNIPIPNGYDAVDSISLDVNVPQNEGDVELVTTDEYYISNGEYEIVPATGTAFSKVTVEVNVVSVERDFNIDKVKVGNVANIFGFNGVDDISGFSSSNYFLDYGMCRMYLVCNRKHFFFLFVKNDDVDEDQIDMSAEKMFEYFRNYNVFVLGEKMNADNAELYINTKEFQVYNPITLTQETILHNMLLFGEYMSRMMCDNYKVFDEELGGFVCNEVRLFREGVGYYGSVGFSNDGRFEVVKINSGNSSVEINVPESYNWLIYEFRHGNGELWELKRYGLFKGVSTNVLSYECMYLVLKTNESLYGYRFNTVLKHSGKVVPLKFCGFGFTYNVPYSEFIEMDENSYADIFIEEYWNEEDVIVGFDRN